MKNCRPRDQQGWRVPASGTTAATIYGLHRQGCSIGAIARSLNCSRANVRVHLFKLRCPERSNHFVNRWRKAASPAVRKPITPAEAHARKVARELQLPLAQARALVKAG